MNAIAPTIPAPLTGQSPEHRAFCLARQEMNRRLVIWLRTGPARADVAEEVAPTQAVLEQLVELEMGR